MNIILVGFMGSGKTAVGHALAKELAMDFVDTDVIIEETEKVKISQIFEQKGERYFRDLETEVIKTLEDYDNFVVACGGGIILREENVDMLKKIGPLVLLWAEPEAIFERLEHDQDRPLIAGDKKKKILDLLEKRKEVYNNVQDFKVDTSELSIEQVAKEIRKWLKK